MSASKKSEKWNWKLMGKADAVTTTIKDRFRQVSEKGGEGLDFEFLDWLANKASDEVFSDLLGHGLNAWQAHLAKEENRKWMEKMEWFTGNNTKITWFQSLVALQFDVHLRTEGWRLPTVAEVYRAVKCGVGDFLADGTYWTSDVSGQYLDYAVVYVVRSGDHLLRSKLEEHLVRFVREKPRRMTVSPT